MHRNVRGALLLAVVAASAGCASLPRAPKEREAEVKAFKTAPGKANLYVFRDEFFGGIERMDVELDAKPIGQLEGRTFLFAEVEPGAHKLMSRAENGFELPFTAVAGENVFVWQEFKMGVLRPRNQLHLVDAARGQRGVAACQLVVPVAPAQ